MAASLTIADNQDGTGATATITGSGGAAANLVSVYSFSATALMALVNTFSRVGDGTIAVDVDPGATYVGVLTEDAALVDVPVFFPATSAPQSLYGDMLAAVQTTLISLGLSGIGSNVLLRKFPWYRDGTTFPAAFVCPFNEQWPNQGTNASDDTGYGISICLARTSNRDNTLAQDNLLLDWRETVRKAFRSKRLAGVNERHFVTNVEPGTVFDPASFGNQYDATFITLRAWAREARS